MNNRLSLWAFELLKSLNTEFQLGATVKQKVAHYKCSCSQTERTPGLKEHNRVCQANMANPYEYIILLPLNY